MPNLTVFQPPANLGVHLNQPFIVSGQASDKGMPEPVSIDSVTVQIDSGPVIDAALTQIHDKKSSLFAFKAFAQVTDGKDPHTVTVTATNDQGISVVKRVAVFVGTIFEVDSPAVLVDMIFPFPLDVRNQRILSLLGQFQRQLANMSAALTAAGKVLAGPNLFVDASSGPVPVLRIGLWIEDPTFPVVAPSGPFSLPRLSDEAASAGFNTVPLLPVATMNPLSFAISIPVRTLQTFLDSLAPALKAAASQQGASLDSLTIQVNSPGSVTTSFTGSGTFDIPFSVSVTETLGTQPLADAQPQSVPAVVGSSHSASVAGIPDWFIYLPLFGADLFAIFAAKLGQQVADQVTGLVQSLVAGIPSRIPFSNTTFPSSPFLTLPDFPTFIPNWTAFGVDNSGILGGGTATIEARDQSIANISVSGSNFIAGYQEDLAGGAGQTYTFTLANLSPDPDKFSWQVSGTGSTGDSIDRNSFDQGGSFAVDFPLPEKVKPGTFPFNLVVSANETCGSDSNKTLTASASRTVQVEVLPNPKTSP